MSADAGVCCLTGVSGRSKESRSLAKNRGNLAVRIAAAIAGGSALVLLSAFTAFAQEEGPAPAGEANLKLPDLSAVKFLGIDGHTLLLYGIAFCILGLIFGISDALTRRRSPS